MGLRWVAMLEFVKGALFLLFALGALSLGQRDIARAANTLILRLHIDPTWPYAAKLVSATSHLTHSELRMLGYIALGLGILRILEGYFLWQAKHWAEWLAVISSSIYLPFELNHYMNEPSGLAALIFVVNLAIVGYLVLVIYDNHRKKKSH